MKRAFVWLRNFVFPSGVHCLCCGCGSRGAMLCDGCMQELNAVKLRPGSGDTRSVWHHTGCARQLVIALKHDNQGDCASVLAQGMANVANTMELPPDTVLTWVTMPERRRRERGVDHGRLLCEAVAERTGMPVRPLLTRSGRIHTQEGLSRAERMQNLKSSFVCVEKVDVPVLVIDDVMTTGATAEACRTALREAGSPRVFVLTATKA